MGDKKAMLFCLLKGKKSDMVYQIFFLAAVTTSQSSTRRSDLRFTSLSLEPIEIQETELWPLRLVENLEEMLIVKSQAHQTFTRCFHAIAWCTTKSHTRQHQYTTDRCYCISNAKKVVCFVYIKKRHPYYQVNINAAFGLPCKRYQRAGMTFSTSTHLAGKAEKIHGRLHLHVRLLLVTS